MTGGSTDPVLVWNHTKKSWWMFYTQRRANTPNIGDITYAYGTKIGAASAHNHGKDWVYRGTLNLEFEHGRNTFWAPDIIYHDGIYHMFVAHISGVHSNWGVRDTYFIIPQRTFGIGHIRENCTLLRSA
jgi:hypothetical protein